MKQAYTEIDSPVGRLLLAGEQGCLRALLFGEGPKRATPHDDWIFDAVAFRPVIDQLNAYFAGGRPPLDVPLHTVGTEFQRRVWNALRGIPYGSTVSYAMLCEQLTD